MNDYPKWPHLENLDRVLTDIPDYFTQMGLGFTASYTITEKVHGFNARFGKSVDGMPWVGSRNQTIAEGLPSLWPDTLQGFVKYAASKVAMLLDGETVFGEWAGKGIQKGIDYGERDFYAFGVMFQGRLLPFENVELTAEHLGMKTVPVIGRWYEDEFAPMSTNPDVLKNLRDDKSRIADSVGEGIVIYPYPPITDAYGHTIIAKYKTPTFEERTRFRDPNKGQPKELGEGVLAFVEEYVTAQRMEHVLDAVAEAHDGHNALDVMLTGDVMREMNNDIYREGKADYDALSDDDKKAMPKVAQRKTKELLVAAREQAMLSLANK